jgi:hypothetical protein
MKITSAGAGKFKSSLKMAAAFSKRGGFAIADIHFQQK